MCVTACWFGQLNTYQLNTLLTVVCPGRTWLISAGQVSRPQETLGSHRGTMRALWKKGLEKGQPLSLSICPQLRFIPHP